MSKNSERSLVPLWERYFHRIQNDEVRSLFEDKPEIIAFRRNLQAYYQIVDNLLSDAASFGFDNITKPFVIEIRNFVLEETKRPIIHTANLLAMDVYVCDAII